MSRVGGHAGFEFHRGIVYPDLDAIDEFGAFLFGLDLLGGKLGLLRNERNSAFVDFVRIGIGFTSAS